MSAIESEVQFLGYETDEAGERAARQARNDLQIVLRTRPGRRLLFRILGDCRILQASFTESATVSAYNEGSRAVGLRLLAAIHDADPLAYVKMLDEAREEESNG